jgi:hypothetical protein
MSLLVCTFEDDPTVQLPVPENFKTKSRDQIPQPTKSPIYPLRVVTLGDAGYLIMSGSCIAACAGAVRPRGSMQETAAAPRTTIPEIALRLERPQVAFREEALLLQQANRIFLGSDGHRHLIGENKNSHRELNGALKLRKLNTSKTNKFSCCSC